MLPTVVAAIRNASKAFESLQAASVLVCVVDSIPIPGTANCSCSAHAQRSIGASAFLTPRHVKNPMMYQVRAFTAVILCFVQCHVHAVLIRGYDGADDKGRRHHDSFEESSFVYRLEVRGNILKPSKETKNKVRALKMKNVVALHCALHTLRRCIWYDAHCA
eukprot:6201271-Pleurochrysis_carterae.AAC.3